MNFWTKKDRNGRIEFRWPLYLLLWTKVLQKKWHSPHTQQKSPKCSTWAQFQKWQNDISSFPRQTIQHRNNQSLCPNHWCWRSWNWPALWRPTWPSRTNTQKKRCLYITGDWNAKVGCQEIPGVTAKFALGVHNEAGQKLTEFCQENTLVIANTLFQQHKRWLYTWTSWDGQYWNKIDYILCNQRWRNSI